MNQLRQPLLPKPANASARAQEAPQDRRKRLVVTVGAFVCFVAVRSVHPIVIDISKTDGGLAYGKATPCVINSAVDIVIGNLLAFLWGGTAGLRQCWEWEPLKIFSAIAVLYAFGDFLEMQSMSVMGGSAYQILLQSKLLVTALIIWVLRGQRQSALQWNVLLTIAIGMSAFVLVESATVGKGQEQPAFRPVGLLFVLAKVIFSCLCAVLAEKYLKAYKVMPIYVQVAQLKFAWLWVSLLLTISFDKNVVESGFFSGWDVRTVFVAVSWVCKGWTTFLVLKNLDSVLKNIGEAVAIVVIYAFDVLIAEAVSEYVPVKAKAFRLDVFLVVLVVVLTVLTYTLAGSQAQKVENGKGK